MTQYESLENDVMAFCISAYAFAKKELPQELKDEMKQAIDKLNEKHKLNENL